MLVVGKAVYRASGRPLRIDAESVTKTTDEGRFFSSIPKPVRQHFDWRGRLRLHCGRFESQRDYRRFDLVRGPQHVFEYVNERYKTLLAQRNLVGLPVREAVPEVSGQGFFEILDRVYSTGEPFIGTELPIQLRASDSDALQTRYLDFIYQPMRGEEGAVVGILVHGVDVTERRLSEQRLRELADAMPHSTTIKSWREAAAVVNELAQEVDRRQKENDTLAPSLYLNRKAWLYAT